MPLTRSGIRKALIARATRKRPNLAGSGNANLDRTVSLPRKPRNKLLSELVTLVCDGLWQGQRLFHAGKRPSKLAHIVRLIVRTRVMFSGIVPGGIP